MTSFNEVNAVRVTHERDEGDETFQYGALRLRRSIHSARIQSRQARRAPWPRAKQLFKC